MSSTQPIISLELNKIVVILVVVFFLWELIIIEIRMQKAPTRISITQVLYIHIAGQEERLPLLPGEAGKNAMFLLTGDNIQSSFKVL